MCPQYGRLEQAKSTLFFLMSRYGIYTSAWIACAVVQHLELLLEEDGFQLAPIKQDLYSHLLQTWKKLAGRENVINFSTFNHERDSAVSTKQPIVKWLVQNAIC